MHHENTNIKNKKTSALNEIVAVTRDSAQFYTDAAKKVDNPQLKQLFEEMASSKNGLVGAMSREIRAEGGQPSNYGTLTGTLNQIYGDVRAKLGDSDYAYVSRLEEGEDRILGAINEIVSDGDTPAPVRQAVQSYLPTARQHHDLMRDRKWSMQTAS